MATKKVKGVMDALTDAAAAGRRAARQAQQGVLRTGESKPDSTGTASRTRLNLGQLGAKTKGQAKSLEQKMTALEKLDDKKGEPAQLLRNAIRDIKRKLPANVVKEVTAKVKTKTTKSDQQLMKGGSVTKSRTGPHDYRMNKGGLLLTSVDNRKKKE